MLLKLKQAAERLSTSESKLRNLVRSRTIGHYRIGATILFSEDHIAEFLSVHERKQERGNEPAKTRPPRPRLKHIKL